MFQHAHHAKVTPSFCKTYGRIGAAIQEALNEYKQEVAAETFPGKDFAPYKLNADEREKFEKWSATYYRQLKEKEATQADGPTHSASATSTTTATTTDETIKVY
jgi:hypothetical protein